MSDTPEATDTGIYSEAMTDEPGFDDADTADEQSGEDGPETTSEPTTGPGGQIAPREDEDGDQMADEGGLLGDAEQGDPSASFNR